MKPAEKHDQGESQETKLRGEKIYEEKIGGLEPSEVEKPFELGDPKRNRARSGSQPTSKKKKRM